jgi:hypothetical protein
MMRKRQQLMGRWHRSPKRNTIACTVAGLALALWLAAGYFAAFGASAHAARALDTAGMVTGTAVNATLGNAPMPGLLVTLQAVTDGVASDAASTHTDASGHFSFSGLDTSGLVTYAVYAHFQGGLFATPAIGFTSGPSEQVTLDVYDTTTSDAALSVVSTTMLVSKPNQLKGQIPVGILETFSNSGKTAYVASVGPANGLPTNLLRFWLPENAENLTLGAGFSGLQVTQVSTGFGVNATVPPGESAYAFAYVLPYSGSANTLQFKTEYASDQVDVLVPPSFKTGGPDFKPEPSVQANGQKYKVAASENLRAGSEVSLVLSGLPLAGENPDIDFFQLVLVGLALLLLLLGFSFLFIRRGSLAVVFGWVPASLLSPARAKAWQRSTREAERKRLLRALLTLDERRSAGRVTEATYARRRAQLRAALRPLLAEELPSAGRKPSVDTSAKELAMGGKP